MITTHETNDVSRGNTGMEQTFAIKASSKAFQILSGGLYSDKILAIVRELCCNAYDAHVAANKKDTPIEVKLPTTLDPTFYVKDFGTGLSHEQICSLYTTYFDSTKSDSNDFIGALGLGSKSPFSYVSTFAVESRYDGMRRVYSCFINEQGLPSITQLGEEPTDEENGLTVTLSAKKDDSYKFNSAAKKALMYFDPTPVIVGQPDFQPFSLTHTVEGSNWKIRVNDYYAYMNGPQVVQGFVAYPIDSSILAEHGLTPTAKIISRTGIDFTVDIGQVDVAASREALSYDVRTIKNLVNIFERAASEMRESFQKSIDKCTTRWEVASFVREIHTNDSYDFRNLFQQMHQDKPFEWQGQIVSGEIIISIPTVKGTNITCYGPHRVNGITAYKRWTPCETSNLPFKTHAGSNVFIITDTASTGNRAGYKSYYDTLVPPGKDRYGRREDAHLIVIHPKNKDSYNQEEIDHIIEQLGNPSYKTAAELGIIKQKQVRTKVKRDKQDRLVWKDFPKKPNYRGTLYPHRVFSGRCWGHEIIDIDDGGFYLPVERFTVVDEIGGGEIKYIDCIIEHATNLGFIDNETSVYGFREVDIKKLPKDHTWQHLVDFIKFKYHQMDHDGKLSGRVVIDKVCHNFGGDFTSTFVRNWPAIENTVEDGDFKTYVAKLYEMETTCHDLNREDVKELQRYLGIDDTSDEQAKEFIAEWDNLVNTKYEMLKYVNFYDTSTGTDKAKRLINYINLIEKNSLTSDE